MKSRIAAALGLSAALWPFGSIAGGKPPDIASEYAVTFQMNVAHTGAVDLSEPFAPPFKQLWDKPFDAQSGYALIAEGNVYSVVGGTDLLAFDLASGTQRWEHVLSLFNNLGGYDAGQLFYVNAGGLMTALTAKNGRQNWATQMPGQSTFNSPPVAQNGVVYVSGGGGGADLYAVDEAGGTVKWDIQGIWGGPDGSPSLGARSVFVDADCHFYGFDAATGQLKWLDDNLCSGGSYTSVYYKHKVYMKDIHGRDVLKSKSGKLVGSFSGDLTPTIYKFGKRSYLLTVVNAETGGATIYCTDLKTGNVAWKFQASNIVWTPPVYASGYVIVGDYSGNVYVLDAAHGLSQWMTTLSHPVFNIAIGQGAFVVTASDVYSPYHSEVAAYAPQ